MANSIDDVLSKMSPEQKAQFEGLKQKYGLEGEKIEPDKAPTADLKQSKEGTPQLAEEAQKTTEKNDPTIGNEQTPQQAQSAQNAVDRALDKQTKAQVAEIGQTLSKEGVTTPQPKQDQEKDR